MYLYAAITPKTCNVTRYRRISEHYEIYELIYGILDEEETEEYCHTIADDVLECQKIFKTWDGEKSFKGVYDYEKCRYLDEADILDLVECQINSEV